MKILSILIAIAIPLFLFSLSLEEKAGQLLIVHFNGETVNEEACRLINEAHVGGFIYYNWSNGLTSPKQATKLSSDLQKLSSIPLWICIDQEGGPVNRLKTGFPDFPGNREAALLNDPARVRSLFFKSGRLLRSYGINMNLAPVVDVSAHPTSYMMNRTFADSPELVAELAEQAILGLQAAGVCAAAKHFPGYGSVENDPHAVLPISRHSFDEFNQIDLLPFKRISKIADAVMTAHILAPALDGEKCATLSKPILKGILRQELGFEGLIISDSLVMEGLLAQHQNIGEIAIEAINAGCDLLILGGKQLLDHQRGYELSVDDIITIHRNIVEAVKTNRITQERLNNAVQRSLDLKNKRLY